MFVSTFVINRNNENYKPDFFDYQVNVQLVDSVE